MGKQCAFIGLGVMGYPMAGHLQNAGHSVSVFNRTTAKAEKWSKEFSGNYGKTPAEAVKNADFVMVCVGNDDDVRSVFYGDDGLLSKLKPGAVVIDHTTASAELARELELAVKEKEGSFLDAPVSGGQAGAENGVLTAMVGGSDKTFAAADELFQCYAKTRQLMGPVGSGQLAKMVNQICIAGVLQGLSEGLQLARKVGLDPDKLIAAISKGAAGSWQMENRYKTMWDNHYEHGFAVDWMRKDLKIALAEADRQGVSLPATALIDQFYADVQKMGGNRWDTSSLLARLEK
ncbi:MULTISPECIES: NAD(P)-dependent oxidoreductase [Idiomarina]|jgi:3-hydroxyisobutyrate dehydrogenase-like beta-hydroxyacid dehydrogenase|uniref:NAD(P)-dependent oxidoreductase n=1 Tax=Idiomarina TaxID=135575 RepID=UPI0006C8C831|nr:MULTISPECIES: NAD(P)-dependent oxidoreductase [Idiomarina]KPD22553.1 oxidoreductase [Idiomarina abyssalis]MAL83758.1 NAD(P)-dependent oxidoreductase [Idiomarina sp.]MBH95220.1 NAD(P)-dependent oxidoreductase [Idiomarina sp.]SFT43050.1 3-hydroxyisobutyrate dehydrogenase [Idiomarina abyssalis]HAS13957.1 NAD(P)-dependent oxidoreductase [Idiomarina abyssalis]|tara:strand:- start:389 stop:1258 length:870 start_codon:yes stop_codon:yes gene_type:complete